MSPSPFPFPFTLSFTFTFTFTVPFPFPFPFWLMFRLALIGGWGLPGWVGGRVEVGAHSALWPAGPEYREKVPD